MVKHIKSLFGTLKSSSKLLIAVTAATVVGVTTTGIVIASIPDGSGVFHGCVKADGTLIVKDDNGTGTISCGSQATPISWNQTGPQGPQGPAGNNADPVAYGFIPWLSATPGTFITPQNSKNINSVYLTNKFPDLDNQDVVCIDVAFNPHTFFINTDNDNAGPPEAAINLRGDSDLVNSFIDTYCGSNYNAVMTNTDRNNNITNFKVLFY